VWAHLIFKNHERREAAFELSRRVATRIHLFAPQALKDWAKVSRRWRGEERGLSVKTKVS
jgi:hypothetical protein